VSASTEGAIYDDGARVQVQMLEAFGEKDG